MEYSYSNNEIGNIVNNKELWDSLADYYKTELGYEPVDPYVKWTNKPTTKNLNLFWDAIEADEDSLYLEVDCYFGNITFYRNVIRVWFSTIFYSYKFFHDTNYTRNIIQVGRIFAKYLNTDKVLYIPDGYRKTAIIEDYVYEGNTIDEIIDKGVKQFGSPPQGISKGRKNYFFVDYVKEEIGEIKDWETEEEFWIWNEDESEFEQIKK